MDNVVKMEIYNALEIPEEIIFGVMENGIDEINEGMAEAGFDKEKPIWFASGVISDKQGLDCVNQGDPYEVISDFLTMKNDGYDDVKLFIVQEK
jgi:hypothetical protein